MHTAAKGWAALGILSILEKIDHFTMDLTIWSFNRIFVIPQLHNDKYLPYNDDYKSTLFK